MGVQVYESMLGKVMKSVTGNEGGEAMCFTDTEGKTYTFEHDQDCCESVSICDIAGDLEDLVGSPILMAEDVDNMEDEVIESDSYTWTYYKYATVKGSVTVRWLGQSNGYYSESVSYREGE